MRESVKDFFAALHRVYLKPRAYRKVRHTFSREMDAYTERVQFQGSSWNDSTSPWRFYINFGVEFHNLPPRFPCRDFPNTHCWTRIEGIVPSAPAQYDLPGRRFEDFSAEIAGYLETASQRVSRRIGRIRAAYEQKKWPLLTLT